MQRTKNFILWTIIAAQSTHIFCCVLPTLFSFLSLLSVFGMVVAMPPFMTDLHDVLHDWEVPMIIFSAIVVGLGWAAYLYARQIDCHEGEYGCSHEPCEPQKDRSLFILKVASVLFLVNVCVYVVLHRGMEVGLHSDGAHIHTEHDGHGHFHHHDHDH